MYSINHKLPLSLHTKIKNSKTFIPENIMEIKYEDLKMLSQKEKELLLQSIRKTLIERNTTKDGKILQSVLDEIDNFILKGIQSKLVVK
jgi:hypothetical protein